MISKNVSILNYWNYWNSPLIFIRMMFSLSFVGGSKSASGFGPRGPNVGVPNTLGQRYHVIILDTTVKEFWGEKKLSDGPALHYVPQTLIWLVMQHF